MTDADAALFANVKVGAHGASIAGTGFKLARADVTAGHESWLGRIVQVV